MSPAAQRLLSGLLVVLAMMTLTHAVAVSGSGVEPDGTPQQRAVVMYPDAARMAAVGLGAVAVVLLVAAWLLWAGRVEVDRVRVG